MRLSGPVDMRQLMTGLEEVRMQEDSMGECIAQKQFRYSIFAGRAWSRQWHSIKYQYPGGQAERESAELRVHH